MEVKWWWIIRFIMRNIITSKMTKFKVWTFIKLIFGFIYLENLCSLDFAMWQRLTRLVTRTEESGVCASRNDWNQLLHNESETYLLCSDLVLTLLYEHCYFGLSISTYTRTRKIVNYTWIGRSREKFWWRTLCSADVQIACQRRV